MNKHKYFRLCKKYYAQELGAVAVLCILTYLQLPIYITFPLIMYELSSLGFNIGNARAYYKKPDDIKLTRVE